MESDNNLSCINASTDNNTDDGLSSIQIVASVVFFIFGLVSIVGNIVFCVAMYRSQLLRSGGYLTLVHYAITDIMTGCIEAFYMPLSVLLQNTFGPSYIYGFILTFDEMASKLFIVFIAFTRFYSIAFPLKARGLMHISWYNRAIKFVWAASIILCIPLWVAESQCFMPKSYHWKFNKYDGPWVTIYTAIFDIGTTAVILIVYPICFYKMLRTSVLWNGRGADAHRRQSVSLQSSHRELKILYLFFVNGIVFTLYWLPVYLVNWCQVSIPNIDFFEEIMRCIETSYNPFLYICVNNIIRNAVKKLLCKKDRTSSVSTARLKLISSSSSSPASSKENNKY